MPQQRPRVPWVIAIAVVILLALAYWAWSDGRIGVNHAVGSDAGADESPSGRAALGAGGSASSEDGLGLAWAGSENANDGAAERVQVFSRPGGSHPTIAPTGLVATLRGVRERVVRCVQDRNRAESQDGPAGSVAPPRLDGPDGGTGEPAMASFNLEASGRLVPDSFNLAAPASPLLRDCYTEAFGEAEFPPPGESGAYVRIRLE